MKKGENYYFTYKLQNPYTKTGRKRRYETGFLRISDVNIKLVN